MKKQILSVIIIFSLIIFPLSNISHAADLTLNNTPTQIYFSPKGGCTEAITNQIDNAKSEILVQAYSFTSAPIAKALIDAHKRGVKVEVILDKSQRNEKYTSATFLANSGYISLRFIVTPQKTP
jgi:phosphatidylserine/phosphatidylglycerophosphate/cardiolipin synthase-like enzyme